MDCHASARRGRVSNELTFRSRGYRIHFVNVGGRRAYARLRRRKARAANRTASAYGAYGDNFQGRVACDERSIDQPELINDATSASGSGQRPQERYAR